MYKVILIFTIILGIISCSKSGKYAGEYLCEVNGHFYELNSYNIDTVYRELLEVNREKKSISTLGRTIPGDSLVEGEWYKDSGYPNIFKIMFIADSMYVYSWSGGQGGGTSHFYSCKQK